MTFNAAKYNSEVVLQRQLNDKELELHRNINTIDDLRRMLTNQEKTSQERETQLLVELNNLKNEANQTNFSTSREVNDLKDAHRTDLLSQEGHLCKEREQALVDLENRMRADFSDVQSRLDKENLLLAG